MQSMLNHYGQQVRDATKKLLSKMSMERVALIATAIASVLVLVVLADWLWARTTGGVKLSNDQFAATLTFSLIGIIVGGIVALVATVLHLRGWRMLWQDLQGWRQPHLRRVLPALVAVVTLVAALAFGLGTLRPRVQLALFAQNIQQTCATPLSHIQSDLQGAGNAAQQNLLDDSLFAQDMNTYAQRLQQDAAEIPHDLAQVRALKAPNAAYQGMVTACATEYQTLANFLGSSTGVTLPTILPAPWGGMQLSAPKMLQLIASLALGKLANAPQIPAFLLGPVVAGALTLGLTTCDAACQQLKSTGVQLQTDIFAPFKPQTIIQ